MMSLTTTLSNWLVSDAILLVFINVPVIVPSLMNPLI